MSNIVVHGITVDVSEVENEDWKWRGKLTLSQDGAVATAYVISSQGAWGAVFVRNVEGESDELCDAIVAHKVAIERALAEALGDPRDKGRARGDKVLHVVTSCMVEVQDLVAWANQLSGTSGTVQLPPYRPHNLQAAEADRLITTLNQCGDDVVAVVPYEMVVLRLIRRVREGVLEPERLVFHVLSEVPGTHPEAVSTTCGYLVDGTVGVDAEGDLTGPWGGGFFTRWEEVF